MITGKSVTWNNENSFLWISLSMIKWLSKMMCENHGRKVWLLLKNFCFYQYTKTLYSRFFLYERSHRHHSAFHAEYKILISHFKHVFYSIFFENFYFMIIQEDNRFRLKCNHDHLERKRKRSKRLTLGPYLFEKRLWKIWHLYLRFLNPALSIESHVDLTVHRNLMWKQAHVRPARNRDSYIPGTSVWETNRRMPLNADSCIT